MGVMMLVALLFAAPPSSQDRKTLLFDHLPKAGGTSVKEYLTQTIGPATMARSIMNNVGLLLPGKALLPKRTWVLVPEFISLSEVERDTYFTIGMIREPCSYYLSLWAFGSKPNHPGSLARNLEKKGLGHLYGENPGNPSDSDLERFTSWLRQDAVKGSLTARLAFSTETYTRIEDVIGSHARSLQASMRVTNGMHFGCPLPLRPL
jgi:hypothetical protein